MEREDNNVLELNTLSLMMLADGTWVSPEAYALELQETYGEQK